MIKILFNVFKRDQQSIKLIKASKMKRLLLNIVICLAIIGTFASILFPLIINANQIKIMIPINIGNIVLMLGFYLTFILALLSSLGFLFSGGYLDKNLSNYVVLPIKKRDFVIAKLMLVYYNVVQLVLLLMVPFIIIYIIYGYVTVSGILSIIIYIFTMPIITIYIVSVLVGTVLYFVNKVKNKAMAKNLLYTVFFLVVFSIYMFVVLFFSLKASDDVTATISMIFNVINKVGTLFIYPSWASKLLNNADYLNLIYMMGVLLIGFVSLIYFEKIYFKGSIGFNESGTKSKTKALKMNKMPHHSITTWFFIKEAKEITKTGVYFFNTIFGNILIVIIYLAMMGYSFYMQAGDESLHFVFKEIRELIDINIVILITLGIGTFFTIFNNGAATVFTRDIKIVDFINSLPLNQSRAFFGKVLFHTLVEFLTLFIFMIIPMLVIGISVEYILTAVIIMILVVLATNLIPVCVDLNFPTLDWESETYVVKRSRSIWMSLIAHAILNALVFGGAALMMIYLNLDYKLVSYLGIIFYAIMFIVLIFIYRKSVGKAFRKVKN